MVSIEIKQDTRELIEELRDLTGFWVDTVINVALTNEIKRVKNE